MDFRDTPEQGQWREEVRTFLKTERPSGMEDASPQEMARMGRERFREWREKLAKKGSN